MERQLLLLGLLLRQEMHAYKINEFIEEKMHFCIDLKRPTAYYTLDRLADEGLVQVEITQQGNRPPRRVYHITDSGKTRFYNLLRRNLEDYHQTFYPTDVGIAFLDQIPVPEAAGYLRGKREKIKATLDTLHSAIGHTGPLKRVIEHNQLLLKAELQWVDGLIADLEETE